MNYQHPGMTMSDKHSKDEIKRLEGANQALSKALSSHADYPEISEPQGDRLAGGYTGGNMPSTEYPHMPANTRVAPIQPSPVAQKVAAQNQVMAPAAQPQAQMPPQGQPQMPQRQGGFDVQLGRPDLSRLDEAYANLGRGG